MRESPPHDGVMPLKLPRHRGSRGIAACAALVLACSVGGNAVLADSHSGTTGHYAISDSTSHPGATCNYTSDYPNHYLVSLTIRAPSVWWPNTTASDTAEHGTVGWLPAVQRQHGSAWTTVASGAWQQAVAHEDRPLHDPADRALFTNQTVSWSTGTAELYRVVIKLAWYGGNSSVVGQAKHVVKHYRLVYPGYAAASPGSCSGRLTILG
jgi:hypothetical protein